jgi:ATP-dependent Clp protease ATP-binding subunit ClpA
MFERYSYSALRLILIALWSARRRGGSYIEAEDLLHAIVREDRGEFAAISSEIFPRHVAARQDSVANRPFFSGDVAADVLQELHEDPGILSRQTRGDKLEPVPHVDMPLSGSLKRVLALVDPAHRHDKKTIEPLDLLAGLVANQNTRLAQMLHAHGITRQKVTDALGSAS